MQMCYFFGAYLCYIEYCIQYVCYLEAETKSKWIFTCRLHYFDGKYRLVVRRCWSWIQTLHFPRPLYSPLSSPSSAWRRSCPSSLRLVCLWKLWWWKYMVGWDVKWTFWILCLQLDQWKIVTFIAISSYSPPRAKFIFRPTIKYFFNTSI